MNPPDPPQPTIKIESVIDKTSATSEIEILFTDDPALCKFLFFIVRL